MDPQTRVLGIGQCALDMLAVVDPYPAADEKTEVIGWHEQGGGPAATAMVTLARLGVACSLAGVIGADAEGGKIQRVLAEAGVDASGLVSRPNGRSQLAFIAVEQSTGKRTIFWRRASAFELSPSELPAGFPHDFHFLHLDGMMEGISICAAQKARAAGIPVMLDAGWQGRNPRSWKKLKKLDIHRIAKLGTRRAPYFYHLWDYFLFSVYTAGSGELGWRK